jgi:hypothetical protein
MRDEARRVELRSNPLSSFLKQGEKAMSENERQDDSVNEDQNPTAELSPSEKLEDVTPTGSLIPGAQNPESKEIKKEVNPNTE